LDAKSKPIRVGIALHPHVEIETGLATRVSALIPELDGAALDKRPAASKTLLDIGPLAIHMLRADLSQNPPSR
jgi:hypothetical protein